MNQHDLEQRLAELTERIYRIERILALPENAPKSELTPIAPEPLTSHPAAAVSPSIAAKETSHAPPVPKSAPPSAPPLSPARLTAFSHLTTLREDQATDELRKALDQPAPAAITPQPPSPPIAPPVAPPAQQITRPAPLSRAPQSNRPTLEFLIGGKWMAWIGAIVVVIAVGFAVKIGIDRGWWGHLGPLPRCLMIAAFGALLLAAGEIALRRVSTPASVGLFGAALGTLYLDAYSAFNYFNLLGQSGAFILMAVVALLGIAITVRTRFLTIGVLSLVGGYLTPLLLSSSTPHHLELLLYLTMLLGISLALSALCPRPFRTLRYVSLGGLAIITLGWSFSYGTGNWQLAIAFFSAWWCMILGESLLAALRRQSSLGNVVITLLSTASYVTLSCFILHNATPASALWTGEFTILIALLGAFTAFQFGPGLEALRTRPSNAIEKLALSLWAQSGVLLAVAVALQFDGYGQTIAWLAIALASVEIARRLPSRGVAVFGLIVGSLALFRIVSLDWINPGAQQTLTTLFAVNITRWSLLALAGFATLHAAAHRLRENPPAYWLRLPIVLTVLATILWSVICMTQCDGLTITTGWLLCSVALLALEPFGRRQRYLEVSLVFLIATAARWLIVDAFLYRMSSHWHAADALPVLNPQMGLALAIAAVGWFAFRRLQRREAASSQPSLSSAWQLTIILALIFTLIALSLEADRFVLRLADVAARPLTWSVDHLRNLLLTMLWAAGATAVGLLARMLRSNNAVNELRAPRLLTQFAWILLSGCIFKYIVVDTLFSVVELHHIAHESTLSIINLQMLAAAMLSIAGITLTTALSFDSSLRVSRLISPANLAPIASSLIILWGLSFELDRALSRLQNPLPAFLAPWLPLQTFAILLTALWSLGGLAMCLLGRAKKINSLRITGWIVCILCATVWLFVDAFHFRFWNGPAHATVIFNLQFLVGLFASALLFATWKIFSTPPTPSASLQSDLRTALAVTLSLIVLISITAGSLEIDRALVQSPMARQAALSVYWGLWGIGLVLAGFVRRHALTRYAGLAILSLTILKVLFIDLASLDSIARVVSFLVSGLLLIATSVVYSRLAPKFLDKPHENQEPNAAV